MPQISQIAATYGSQLFWLLLTFGLTFFVIGLGMYPKVQGTAIARDKKIADDLEAARHASADADQIEAKYRTRSNADRQAAQALVSEAKAAQAIAREQAVAAADADIGTTLGNAETDLAARTAAAMADIDQVATDATRDLVARISGLTPSEAEARDAVKAVHANG